MTEHILSLLVRLGTNDLERNAFAMKRFAIRVELADSSTGPGELRQISADPGTEALHTDASRFRS